jgi:hypothetical protein
MSDTVKNAQASSRQEVRQEKLKEIYHNIEMKLTPKQRAAQEMLRQIDDEYNKKHLNAFINSF